MSPSPDRTDSLKPFTGTVSICRRSGSENKGSALALTGHLISLSTANVEDLTQSIRVPLCSILKMYIKVPLVAASRCTQLPIFPTLFTGTTH